MRIRLKEGKQKELVLSAKKDFTWKFLAGLLKISEGYLRNELRNEKTILGEGIYKKLCKISGLKFDRHIVDKVNDNWGKIKGGKNSSNNTKNLDKVLVDENLAEIFGIILGDGHVQKYEKGKKIRCYSIIIAGNSETDRNFMEKYVPFVFENKFNFRGRVFFSKSKKEAYYKIHGKQLVDFVISNGILSGNKKKNNQGIPIWIKENRKYLSRCIKGLVDTDGSIHYISKTNKNLRISYTSHIPNLMRDVREGLVFLGFNPSKIINERQIFLSGKRDVEKYIKEIGFSNQKNLNRLENFKRDAPVV